MNEELRQMVVASAAKLGISPVDLATAISYETAGSFDPMKKGPTTKWGQHRGLIQWGEPQAQKYLGGDFSIPNQGEGIVQYMKDAGVQPGMGMLDVYSAINAGSVGRHNASDTAAGGAPGTVADKVRDQMEGHRQKALALLGNPPAPDREIGGDSMVPRSFPGMNPAGAFGSMAPPPGGPAPDTGFPSFVADYANSPEPKSKGEIIGNALSQIEVMPAPRPSPHPGGPSDAQATALLKLMQDPNGLGRMFQNKRLGRG